MLSLPWGTAKEHHKPQSTVLTQHSLQTSEGSAMKRASFAVKFLLQVTQIVFIQAGILALPQPMANSIPLQLQGRFSFSSACDFWLTEGTDKHRWPQPQQSLKVTQTKNKLKTEASVSDSFCSKPWTFKKVVSRKRTLTYVYCHFHGGHSIAK